jgi:hypothetical protein
MKYKVGDLVLLKDIRLPLRLRVRPHLHNTLGIITEVEKHSNIFEKDLSESDNGYIWYSQVDNKEYYFYQDEVDGEVIK